jgi:hypothetical protein
MCQQVRETCIFKVIPPKSPTPPLMMMLEALHYPLPISQVC